MRHGYARESRSWKSRTLLQKPLLPINVAAEIALALLFGALGKFTYSLGPNVKCVFRLVTEVLVLSAIYKFLQIKYLKRWADRLQTTVFSQLERNTCKSNPRTI
jgi:hypothetical protein